MSVAPIRPPQMVEVEVSLLANIVNYLGTQPYQEVFQMVGLLAEVLKGVQGAGAVPSGDSEGDS